MSVQIAVLPEGKISDFIDERLRNDTPEEYVRQNIERRLVIELGYPRERVAVEFPIKIGSQRVRVDLAIFPAGAAHVQDNITTIIECKRDSVEPTSKHDGVDQLKSYMSACANAEWGMWTNASFKAVYRRAMQHGRIEWDEPNDIPTFDGAVDRLDHPSREQLIRATDDNMLFAFKTCHNHIYVTDGLQKQPAFFELLKVIFCKIYDERNVPHPLEFFATAKEKSSNDGQLTVTNRLGKIFDAVKLRYPTIFEANDEIKLEPRSLAYVVGELQRYSFLDTDIDVKGKAYEELVGANLRGDRGEFFTPRNVQRMVISMLDLKEGETVLDPACGTGGFLVIAMNGVINNLRRSFQEQGITGAGAKAALTDRVREIASKQFFGFDINPDLVKATKMNMVMNNDGSGNILRLDSLRHPHQWTWEFKTAFALAVGCDPSELRGPGSLALFDVIATNPPFGAKLPIKDRETLLQYELARVWHEDENGQWEPTDELQSSVPPEILFIERCWQFLRPSGRMGIVLPDAILGAPGLGYVRQWIIANFRVTASIDLHPDTFQPRNGTQTSVLLLQRKPEDLLAREARQEHLSDYEIFMAPVENIGHDKRGNTLYRRNDDGEVVLEVPTAQSDGIREARPAKVVADDTPTVAAAFLAWKSQAVLGW